MEEERRSAVVTASFKHASVSLGEILAAGGRLEASVFNIEARQARELIEKCQWPTKPLAGLGGLTNAYHRPRFKRPYVDKHGEPFYQPSQITEIFPQPARYLSSQNVNDYSLLRVTKGQILLTCSGTIGKCSIVGKHLENAIFSHDLIRIDGSTEISLGYIFVFLKSKMGNLLLTTSNYGAVIQHIEPEHLAEIKVPVADNAIIQEINDTVVQSFNLRDESNDLMLEAQEKLVSAIGLPPIDAIPISQYRAGTGVANMSVPLNKLDARFDGSYHHPLAAGIGKLIADLAPEVATIGDSRISKEIILPGRFKRVYVEEGFGVPFLGGKEIGNLDPRTGKNLSLQGHGERIKTQLTIKQNQVLITCSGTIGKINIAPKHWSGWTSSQHVIRIESSSPWMAGYLYAWLSTDYGRELIRRFTYGSVVDEVSDEHIGNVIVPILKDSVMQEIGKLVLDANGKRYQAFVLEQQAMRTFDQKVFGISTSEILYLPKPASRTNASKTAKSKS